MTTTLMRRIGLQFFADGEGSEPSGNQTTPPDYEALFQSDPNLRAFVDRRVNTACSTAVANARAKWQRQNDETLEEAERLREMSADERANYFQRKYETAQRETAAREAAAEKRNQTAAKLRERNIPDAMLDLFDFGADDDAITARLELLGGYEYRKPGEFDEAVQAALDEKLQQQPPASGGGGSTGGEDAALRESMGLPPIKT